MFVKFSRNMLQPVNKLPPEIISHIARDISGRFDLDARRMVPLTHACRYWRESIALAPENWSMIFSHSEPLAALSLEAGTIEGSPSGNHSQD